MELWYNPEDEDHRNWLENFVRVDKKEASTVKRPQEKDEVGHAQPALQK